jgi:type IV secretory pathway VirB10-like protein
MKKNKLKEISIVISIFLGLVILLLGYGYFASKKDQTKSPDFQKFVLTTNFPMNEYIYPETKETTNISKIFDKKNNEVKEEKEKSFSEKAEELKRDLLNQKKNYTNNIFPSNKEIKKAEIKKQRRQILSKLYADIPELTIEKNSLEKIPAKELDFGASSFSNLKTKNSVSNETKLYRTITKDKKIPVILTSSIDSTLSGEVSGIVEEDIYSSMGTAKLIPKGSKALGDYLNNSRLGVNRFDLKWKRFITPQGINIILDSAKSADIKGNSGVVGVLDNRYWERYGLPLTLSTLSNAILLELSSGNDSNRSSQIILDNSRQDISYIMKNVIDEQIKIKPIIRVKEASRVFIVSKYDIWFPQPKDNEILIKYYNKKGEIE